MRTGPAFFDTIGLSPEERRRAEALGLNQEQRIMRLFASCGLELLTPEDVLPALAVGTPITSARRAMTSLARRGKLIKTTIQREGRYGRRIHYWSMPKVRVA